MSSIMRRRTVLNDRLGIATHTYAKLLVWVRVFDTNDPDGQGLPSMRVRRRVVRASVHVTTSRC